MKKSAIFLLIVFVIASYGFTPFPDETKGTDEFGPKARIVELLKLSDDQQAKFNDFHYNQKLMMIDTRAQIQKNRLEIKKMMMDNNINSERILQVTENNNKLRSKIHTSKVKMWLDIYNILNKEQQKIWTKHLARMGDGKHEKFGKGRENHQGAGMGQRLRDTDNIDEMRPRNGKGKF